MYAKDRKKHKEGIGYTYMKYIYEGEGPTGIDTVPGTAERK